MTDIFSFIQRRTSAFTKMLGAPGPTRADVISLLSCATSAPDHGGLTPWRFSILQDNDLEKFATMAIDYFVAEKKDRPPTADEINNFKAKVMRAPTVVAVWASPSDRKPIARREQIFSVAMAVAQIMLAASDPGFPFKAVFLTGFITDHRPLVERAFGLAPSDEFLGYIYIGTEKLPADKTALPQKKRLAIDDFILPLKD
ncbi:MAG: nitroreductase [Hydrotalea sp.]|nr:nitroreductase [Hydrotalea sp.]